MLTDSTNSMIVALGLDTGETHTTKLWLAARKLREVERVDRRTKNEHGINEPPLDAEIGEALRTALNTFTAFCFSVPALQKLEQANRDNAEVSKVPLKAIDPILDMLHMENENFREEVREAFKGLIADTQSNIEGIAERGEAVAIASAENLVHRLIAEAVAEDRKKKPGPFMEAYKKRAGEHAADLTLGTLVFGAKALILCHLAGLGGFTDQLPNADNYRSLLDGIDKSNPK